MTPPNPDDGLAGERGDERRLGPDLRLAAIVICAVLGLGIVAGFLPAVDNADGSSSWDLASDGSPTVDDGSDAADEPVGEDDGTGESSVSTTDPRDNTDREDTAETDRSTTVGLTTTTPGQEAIVAVRYGDEPVPDASVTIDGDLVGTTGREGTVETIVPYEETITVTATGPDGTATTTERLATTIDVTPTAINASSDALVLAASIEGTPVPDARVLVDDERVGTTDDDGTAAVSVEDDHPSVTVVRGAARGQVSIEESDVALAVDRTSLLPGVPVGIPYVAAGPAEATVTVDGDPVEGAPVTVDGEPAGTTGADGTATIRLPADRTATIQTSVAGQSDGTTIEGLYARLAYVTLGASSIVGGIVVTYRRAFDRRQRRAHRRRARRFPRAAAAASVTATRSRFLDPLRVRFGAARDAGSPSGLASDARSSVRELSGGIRSTIGRFGSRGRWLAQFTATVSLPTVSLPAVSLTGLRSLFSGLDRGHRSLRGQEGDGDRGTNADGGSGGVGSPEGRNEDDFDRQPVRRAWHEFVDRLGVYRRETRTPGQIARRAIRRGYPDDAVRRLTTTFREVEYGNRDPTERRVREAREAIEDLRSADGDDRDQ